MVATPEGSGESGARNLLPGQKGPDTDMGKMAAAVGSVATLAAEPREDAFRKLFRFYRQSRPGTADLGAVIDFSAAHAARGTGPGARKVRTEERPAPPVASPRSWRGFRVLLTSFRFQTECY